MTTATRKLRSVSLGCATVAWVLLAATGAVHAQHVFGPIEAVSVASPHPYPAGAPGGSVVWSETVRKDGAAALMLHFAQLDLGPGDSLRLVDEGGGLIFRYEGNVGMRWSVTASGAAVTLELVADDSGGGFGVEVDELAYSSTPLAAGGGGDALMTPAPPQDPVIIGADGLDDIQCLADGVGGNCPDDTEKFTSGTAVARLKIRSVHKKNRAALMLFCTGFLINHDSRDDLIMTAAHCLEDDESQHVATAIEAEFDAVYPLVGGTCNCESATASTPPCNAAANPCDSPDSSGPGGFVPPPGLCGNGVVNAGEACDPRAVPNGCPMGRTCRNNCVCEIPCAGPVCQAVNWQIDPNKDCDWGLIKCPGVPNAGNRLHLPLKNYDPGIEEVYIPQHPDGRCKEIEINQTNDNVAGCSFQHLVDTQGGSSGAPVIRTEAGVTDPVIGVHVRAANFATRMSHILTTPVPNANPPPSDGVEGLDGFLGYKVSCVGPIPPDLEVEDQFMRRTIRFKRPTLLLAPAKPEVDCAGLTELDCAVRLVDLPPPPAVGLLHQRCYGINDALRRPAGNVDVLNQFGSENCRFTGRATIFCAKTAKEEQ